MSGTTPPQFENRGTGPNVAPLPDATLVREYKAEFGPFSQSLLRSKQARLIAEMESVENMPTAEPSSSNWQIRIEALRAAATICTSASFYRTGDYAGDTLKLAKRFERYLESGE